MLEPRRMAARAAAQRMAFLLGEPVGHTVGYRVRQDTRVSKHTRIEVITEGILNRMLLQDPALEGVGLLIFDEFHERNLNADLGLALSLQGRELLREQHTPLRIMVMSATLDGAAIASLLNDAPVIRSAGKMFPVKVVYGNEKRYHDNIVDITVKALLDISSQHAGNILVFLPGQGEINRVMQQLNQQQGKHLQQNTIIMPLYGALPLQQQQRAIDPLSANEINAGKRKLVLATDIAETSLTIAGINVVVDTGLCREPRFDPVTGMTRLQTRRISQDSSIQRMGRAGRLAAGYCYRLWSEQQQLQLARHSTAEILQADLAPLALQLLAWGLDDINELKWLNSPPPGALSQGLALLHRLGATIKNETDSNIENVPADANQSSPEFSQWRLNSHGEAMSTIPVHPRLAHMLISGKQHGLIEQAANLAALLADRSPLDREYGGDISQQLAVLTGQLHCQQQHRGWLKRTRHQAQIFQQAIDSISNHSANGSDSSIDEDRAIGFLLACAYPDRIARRKTGDQNLYLLSNGRSAALQITGPLATSEWLAVAESGGSQAGSNRNINDTIFSASALSPTLFEDQLSGLVEHRETLHWDEKAGRFVAEKIQAVGKLVIARNRIKSIPAQAKRLALLQLVAKRGMQLLPWNNSIRQWQARVMLLHNLGHTPSHNDRVHANDPHSMPWPDVSDQQLSQTLAQWLGPYLDSINKLDDFQRLDLQAILNNLLAWPRPQQLKELAPTSIKVPSGSNIRIDYTENPPVLRVKLQEMFGCQTTPSIASGRVKLMLHLLSPAQRPLQVTQDIAGFWDNSYFEVKKEMKGRYPKHPWPDNPRGAQPTKFTRRRT